jgi:quinohemoprotein ethanol dehydrogenase
MAQPSLRRPRALSRRSPSRSRCHVLGPNVTPDLRKLNAGLQAMFNDIVLRGRVAPTGMESFADILSEKDVDNVHAYLIDQAWQGYRAQEAAAHAAAHP